MALLTQFWEIITGVVSGGVNVVVSLFTSIMAVFFDSTTNAFTPFGVILLISVGAPLVLFGLNWVISLIRSIRLTRGNRR